MHQIEIGIVHRNTKEPKDSQSRRKVVKMKYSIDLDINQLFKCFDRTESPQQVVANKDGANNSFFGNIRN